jgi:hypothetical protein
MGYYFALPLLMIAVVLQASFFPLFFPGTAQPELMLLIVLAWTIHAAWHEALFWAFLGGIMQDLLAITPTGTSVIVPVVVVFVIKWLESRLYQFSESHSRLTRGSCLQMIIDTIRNSFSVIVMLIGFTVLATIANHIMMVLVLRLMRYPTNIPSMVQEFSLPTLAYNLIVILPVYFVLRRIQTRLPKPQSGWDIRSQP